MDRKEEYFPDGTPIDGWFYENRIPSLEELGKLQLTRTALALACSTHWDLRSVRC